MNEIYSAACAANVTAGKNNYLANWLAVAAAPTFAVMALLTAVPNEIVGADTTNMQMHCSHSGSLLGGMALMYALMGIFHAGPWLKWIGDRFGVMRS